MAVAACAPLVLAALLLASCTSGSPSRSVGPSMSTLAGTSPPLSSSPSAGATPFVSKTYGYSLTIPAGWTSVQATATWDGKGAPGHDVAEADQFIGPVAASAWAFAAPTAKSLAAYVQERIAANYADHAATCPATPEAQDPIEIGGQPGTLLAWNCGILINGAVTVRNGVGYLFGFRDPSVHAAIDATDRELFLELLQSVNFAE
jgi:hypothetical protein